MAVISTYRVFQIGDAEIHFVTYDHAIVSVPDTWDKATSEALCSVCKMIWPDVTFIPVVGRVGFVPTERAGDIAKFIEGMMK